MAGEDNQAGNVIPEYNNATTGLNLDQTVNQIPKGKLTYALNAAVENFDSNSVNYQNEPGNEFCLTFPTNYHLIGEHFIIEQNKHIFFLVNPDTGGSQIGYMDNNDCVYHIYIDAPCLAFNIDYPIHKAVHKITNCTTEIYWTDGLNPRRYLDLNNIPYIIAPGATLCDPSYLNEIDCNQLKVQPNFSIPELAITDITTGGDLTAGTYQFAIQYCDAAGNPYTSYYSVTNPTPIANTQVTTLEFNYQVGRSIVVSVNNLDVTGQFQYFNLAVIKTINAISSVELAGTYFITQADRNITYTGQNVTQIRLTINDIFEKYPYYEIAQDLTAVQDILVWDQLTSIDRINYQNIASQITLQWETYKIPATEDYSDALNATNLRGYLRDEVYAFEIVFLLKNGKQTDGFHIPGRALGFNEFSQPDVPTTNPDFIGEPTYYQGGTGYSPYWKIYNTASVTGTALGEPIGNATPYQYGEFAYWESTELYPCNLDVWGNLADTPIRHHKFPDVLVSPIFETPTLVYDGTQIAPVMQTADAVYPIGVRVNTQQISQLIASSNLTADQKADIAAYKIVRGDRATNKSIVAKGILRNVGEYTREKNIFYYPNYPYNDLNRDPFLLTDNNSYDAQCETYTISPAVDGTLTYTDCNTNEQVTQSFLVSDGIFELCSLGRPAFVLPATGVISLANYSTYRLNVSALKGNRYSWVSPVDGLHTEWVDCSSCFLASNPGPIDVQSVTVPINLSDNVGSGVDFLYKTTGTLVCNEDGGNLNGFNDGSKYRMVFNSPETSFGQPFLGGILKLESAIFGAGSAHFVQVQKNAFYKLITKEAQEDALLSSRNLANITDPFNAGAMFTAYQAYLTIYVNGITRRNYAYSFNSIASYDYSSIIDNNLGIKQRELDLCQYLIPGVQNVGDAHNVNNFERESSVYLKTALERFTTPYTALPFPNDTQSLAPGGTSVISDYSRFTISEKASCLTPEQEHNIKVVSYYGSLKNVFVNQWGQMYSYDTIDTGFQRDLNSLTKYPNAVIFGGDTFISRFAFKTKLPFFIDNRVGAPDDSDIFYDEIGNVAYPKYWHSSRSILSDYITSSDNPLAALEFKNIISIKAHNFDCPNSQAVLKDPNRTFYNGKFYLFAYGIPSFYCESSINVDLRQAFNNKEGDFFPHVSTGIPDNWFQQSVVPIAFDNTYYYNVTFSKQNKENFFSHLPPDWKAQFCFTNYPFRAIYSDTQVVNADNRVNNWLTYRATSMFDFPQNYGGLTSLDGIQNKAILARFDNKSLLYNTMLTIQTSNPQAAYLGNDTLFKSAPPIDFAETDLGYVGSQNKMLLKIPQGQITIDAKRGQVFLISGNQAQDLSAFGSGLNRFFTDHLAFEILRYFPDREEIINNERIVIKGVDTDNHFNGCGLHGVFDSKYDRVIISKLDYIPLSDKIKYNSVTRDFYIIENPTTAPLIKIVNLTDPEYFCNKSWTLSFNMNTQSWISFHSYIPNFYVAENNFFYSGLNEGCDLEALAINEIATISTTTTARPPFPPEPITTTTSTTRDCRLVGTVVEIDCSLAGEAILNPITTTTTSTSTSTTTSTSTSTTTTTTTVPPTTTTTTTVVEPTTTTTTTVIEPTTTTTTTTITPTTTTTTTIPPTTTTTTTIPPTTTTTTTVAPPTTTTTTTAFTIQAVLAFSFVNDGSGNIGARLEVTSGTLLDNMSYFSTNAIGYLSSGCSGGSISTTFNNTLFPPGPTATVGVFTSGQSVLSAQAVTFFVDGQSIVAAFQTITVGGNNYTITGGTSCYDV